MGKEPSIKRLLRAVVAWLREHGRRLSRAERTPRVSWKGISVAEGCQGGPADSPFATLTVIQLDRAETDTHPELCD
jgi:hypothetical protein